MTLLYTLRNSANEQFVPVFKAMYSWLSQHVSDNTYVVTTLDDFNDQAQYIDNWMATQDALTKFKHMTNAPGVGNADLYDNIAYAEGPGWTLVYSVIMSDLEFKDEIMLEVEDENNALLFKLACL